MNEFLLFNLVMLPVPILWITLNLIISKKKCFECKYYEKLGKYHACKFDGGEYLKFRELNGCRYFKKEEFENEENAFNKTK